MRHNGKLYTLIRSKVWITENETLNLSTPSRNERIWIIRKNRIMEIYVGNLPWSTSDQELADAFGAYGNVEKASIISDRHSGRSKGFGFVTMNDADEANKAIEAMNGTDMGGRSLKVNEARPREDRPPRQSDW
tara:strand:+ start:405 stop:803 length:399 start_codon:yes stop_codon:yes gene_type:complete